MAGSLPHGPLNWAPVPSSTPQFQEPPLGDSILVDTEQPTALRIRSHRSTQAKAKRLCGLSGELHANQKTSRV